MKNNITLLLLAVLAFCACKKPQLSNAGDADNARLKLLTLTNNPAALSYKNILLNTTGYNPRNFLSVDPWTNSPGLKTGLDSSEANMIRYPGGTFGDYWDYTNSQLFKTSGTNGFVNIDSVDDDKVHNMIQNGHIYKNTVADLAVGAGYSGGVRNVVFQMNMTTPGTEYYKAKNGWITLSLAGDTSAGSTWKAMLDDRYARFKHMLDTVVLTTSIPIKFIELGNEYYFPHPYCKTAFPHGDHFGIACTYIANKIHHDFPNARIAATASCVPGSAGSRQDNWNTKLITTLNKYTQSGVIKDNGVVQNVTMHSYQAFYEPGSYTPNNWQDQLVKWCDTLQMNFDNSDANSVWIAPSTGTKWRIWYTETNANWDGGVKDPTAPADQTWGRNLVDTYSMFRLYDLYGATMLLQFQFNNQIYNTSTGELYDRAKTQIALMRASKGATAVAKLDFDGSSSIAKVHTPSGHATVTMGVIQGAAFQNGSTVKCALINLSNAAVTINLSSVYPSGNVNTSSWSHNPLATVFPHTITPSTVVSAAASISLPAFSVSYIDQ